MLGFHIIIILRKKRGKNLWARWVNGYWSWRWITGNKLIYLYI